MTKGKIELQFSGVVLYTPSILDKWVNDGYINVIIENKNIIFEYTMNYNPKPHHTIHKIDLNGVSYLDDIRDIFISDVHVITHQRQYKLIKLISRIKKGLI